MLQQLICLLLGWRFAQIKGLNDFGREFLKETLIEMTLDEKFLLEFQQMLGVDPDAASPPSRFMVRRAARTAYDVPDEALVSFAFYPDAIRKVRERLFRKGHSDDWISHFAIIAMHSDFLVPQPERRKPQQQRRRPSSSGGHPDRRRWKQSCRETGNRLREITCSR